MKGQRITGTTCKCGQKLPDLVDDHGWGVLDCKCGEWFDVQKAREHGGKLFGPVNFD